MSDRKPPEHPISDLPDDLQVLAHEHGQDYRNINWLHQFARFRPLWAARTSDLVPRGHPMEHWVWKQRRAHKINSMPDWRALLLNSIGFPLRAPKVEGGDPMTDVGYAIKLIDFWRMHGHYAPTQSFGGAGLTRWTRLMRVSNGTKGLVSGSHANAAAAHQLLVETIPNFSWDGTYKFAYNKEVGLSFNGFMPSNYTKPESRMRAVINVAKASLAFTNREESVRAIWEYGRDLMDLDVETFARRIHVFEQAPSITIAANQEQRIPVECDWWLKRADFNRQTSELVLHLHRGANFADTTTVVVSGESLFCGYDELGTGFSLALPSADSATTVILAYDVCLADQTHLPRRGAFEPRRDPPDFSTLELDWSDFMRKDEMPFTLASAVNTAYGNFSRNLRDLKDLQTRRLLAGNADRVHIGWGKHLTIFKFIENLVRKARLGQLPYSHGERLSTVDFTWGADYLSGTDIAELEPRRHYAYN